MKEVYVEITDKNGEQVVACEQLYERKEKGEEILASLERIEQKLKTDFNGKPGVLVAQMQAMPDALTMMRRIVIKTQAMIGAGLLSSVVYVASDDIILQIISELFERYSAFEIRIRHEKDVEHALDKIRDGEY